MTYFYYKTNTWNSQPQISEDQIKFWKHLSEKKNWRIVQLPNGFYQTEYKDINCDCNPEEDTCCEKWYDVTRRETIKELTEQRRDIAKGFDELDKTVGKNTANDNKRSEEDKKIQEEIDDSGNN